MKITALIENTSTRQDITPEHGLSLFIETNGTHLLFDMGQTDLFLKNASSLGVDLGQVDLAVLSHGHYDHGGGLNSFLSINSTAPVYLNENAFLPLYNGTQKYIGLDIVLRGNPRLIPVGDEAEISPSMKLFSCNGRARPNSLGSFGLTERVGEEFIDDAFLHEQYLLIEENGRRILLSGCSHKGILDIATWFRPDVLVGGFHVSKLPLSDELRTLALALNALPTEYYTCHCTGVEQYRFMKQFMPRLHYLSCGETVRV